MNKVLHFRLLLLFGIFLLIGSCEKEEPAPQILQLSPRSGNVGTLVTIKEADVFSATKEDNQVEFNGIATPVLEATASVLTVRVPEGASSGKVSVQAKGKTLLSKEIFSVLSKISIDSLIPFRAPEGAEISIIGTGFSSIPSNNTVMFGELKAEVKNASTTALTVIVPKGVLPAKISVHVQEKSSTSEQTFELLQVDTFSPLHGYAGTKVTIKGKGFHGLKDAVVEFNGVPGIILEANAEQMRVQVPENASSGKITYKALGQTFYTEEDFKVNTDYWTAKADVPVLTLEGPVAFSIGQKAYLGTGSDIKSFWEYDPATDSWTQIADLPGEGRSWAVAFSIAGKGYVGTGFGKANNVLKDFWEYDVTTNSWAPIADFGGGARGGAVAFSTDSKGYVGAGYDTNSGLYLKDFWEYDPAVDTWTRKADFGGSGRSSGVAFAIGNKGYVGTGGSNEDKYLKDFWEYDVTTDSWKPIADLAGVGRSAAIAFSLGGKGYVGTGFIHDPEIRFKTAKDFWEYNPATDQWYQRANIHSNRGNGVGFTIGRKGYIAAGWIDYPDERNITFWEYTPE
jgi:N-acetylneuraminic acid mutarotase